jgi:hypothetical protein
MRIQASIRLDEIKSDHRAAPAVDDNDIEPLEIQPLDGNIASLHGPMQSTGGAQCPLAHGIAEGTMF